MRDLIFGFDVQPIGQKPYKSVTELEMLDGLRESTTLNVKAADLGLRVFPGASVYGGPLVGSHVGADVAADLLAIGMDRRDEVVMLVDVGTNTEVVVGNRHRMMAASCPAGPAFEGGQVTYGMPGYDGAIESVRLDNGTPECRTIGGVEPVGICGSGLVDLLAELRRTGRMTHLGVFPNGEREFFFAPEQRMSLSRADVSALAQAKSANYSGQYIVLRNYGVSIDEVSELYLAGGFANYVNVENAVGIGFIASVAPEKVVKAGNASLEGATLMLVSREMRRISGGHVEAHRARRAGDDSRLLRHICGRLHVQPDGPVVGEWSGRTACSNFSQADPIPSEDPIHVLQSAGNRLRMAVDRARARGAWPR